MIERIIDWSAEHKVVVLTTTFLLAIVGILTQRLAPLDAIPNLSDPQVIVSIQWERTPLVLQDRVVAPIVRELRRLNGIKTVRALTDFGHSFIYVILERERDSEAIRSQVNQVLANARTFVPSDVSIELGPDASSLGWIYQYAIVDRLNKRSIFEIRELQDITLRPQLESLRGVAEIASIGGFEAQYEITIDPAALLSYGISIEEVAHAIRSNNGEFSARTIEVSGAEHMIRGLGSITSPSEIEEISVSARPFMAASADSHYLGAPLPNSGQVRSPVLVKNIATVQLAPVMRRGMSDLDGRGEVVGGIVIMRPKENALEVIRSVKNRLSEIARTLPEGIEIVTVYDRSDLIEAALFTVRWELALQMIIMSVVVLLFLRHIPSAIVPILTLPTAVILTFLFLYLAGCTFTMMSLAGVAISIGVLANGAIIEVENAYRRMSETDAEVESSVAHRVRLGALKEVAPSVFWAALVTAVAFLPVFALEGEEGRLFHPLALAKCVTMIVAAAMVLTVDPALRLAFSRKRNYSFQSKSLSLLANKLLIGKYSGEANYHVIGWLQSKYERLCRFLLAHKVWAIVPIFVTAIATIPVFLSLGREFMPPLFEGSLLYMPTTRSGLSASESGKLLQRQDEIIKGFPEVDTVFGKSGRADTATDPAPLSMMETVITLKSTSEWRKTPRWYHHLPDFVQPPFRMISPDHITLESLIEEMNDSLSAPGISSGWTMPIKARIDMLSTGIRSPVGVKIFGTNPDAISAASNELRDILAGIEGARNVYAERLDDGYYLDIDINRRALASFGLTVADLEKGIVHAVGGEAVGKVFDGRVQRPISLRYADDFRDSPEKLRRVLIRTPTGVQIPLGDVATIEKRRGPSMIRNENGRLCAFLFVDLRDTDIGGYVDRAKKVVAGSFEGHRPVSLEWSGQYEGILRTQNRLLLILPITALLIFSILVINTRSLFKATLVFLTVPFSVIGAIWILYAFGFNISIGVWIGIIALMGMDAEMGVFMMMYLDIACKDAQKSGRLTSRAELYDAIVAGAAKRLRPKLMTVCTTIIGLLPILLASGIGTDLMKRIAAPLIGGLFASFVFELIVYPPAYALWFGRRFEKGEDSNCS